MGEKVIYLDLTVEGSFDEAIKGVDGVFHIASRVTLCVDSNDLVKCSLLLLEINLIFISISIKVVDFFSSGEVGRSRYKWNKELDELLREIKKHCEKDCSHIFFDRCPVPL